MPIPGHGAPPVVPPAPGAPAQAPGAPPAAPTPPATPATPAGPNRWNRIRDGLANAGSFLLWPIMVLACVLLYLFFKGSETALGVLVAIVIGLALGTMFWFVARENAADNPIMPPPYVPAAIMQQDVNGNWHRWDTTNNRWEYWDGTTFVNLS